MIGKFTTAGTEQKDAFMRSALIMWNIHEVADHGTQERGYELVRKILRMADTTYTEEEIEEFSIACDNGYMYSVMAFVNDEIIHRDG